jgi:hypothetical protein
MTQRRIFVRRNALLPLVALAAVVTLTLSLVLTDERPALAAAAVRVQTIRVDLMTGASVGADSDGGVYLGFLGREYRLARADIDDYRRGAYDVYRMGTGGNIEYAAQADPRHEMTPVSLSGLFPTYIRFEPNSSTDTWQMRGAYVVVNGQTLTPWRDGNLIDSPNGRWLGARYGTVVHLRKS